MKGEKIYEKIIKKCKLRGGGASQLDGIQEFKKSRCQAVYFNVILHLLPNLKLVKERSRNRCAMTEQFPVILNLFQDLISGRLENKPSPQPSRIGEEVSCHSEAQRAERIQPIMADGGQEVRRSGDLEGKKIGSLEGKPFTLNSLSSNPPTLLSSNNHLGGNASLIPPYELPISRKGTGKSISPFTLHPSLKKSAFTLAEGAAHVDTTDNVRRAAFTLAEVLITLGIIGVVAALTIPALIANYKEKEIITKAKKNYSVAMQALQLAQAEYGTPNDNSTLFLSANTADEVTKEFAKFIPGGHLCVSSSNETICKELSYKVLYTSYKNKYGYVRPPAVILPDSGVLFVALSDNKCQATEVSGVSLDSDGNQKYNPDGTPVMWYDTRNDCGSITIDINGAKQPNKAGYDVFEFTVWSNRTGKSYWDVMGSSSLFSILSGGKLKYNKNN